MRSNGRRADELRAVRIQRGYTKHAEGAVHSTLVSPNSTSTAPSACLV